MAEDLRLNEQQQQLVHNHTIISPSSSTSSSSSSSSTPSSALFPSDEPPIVADESSAPTTTAGVEVHAPAVNRCVACRKRVGLTGFKCRCGMTFCGPHRYPERHACVFDYKAMGKDQIAMANPVVKAVKLRKI